MSGPGTNTGHGHVWTRPDGQRARCGGPAICAECARDAAQLQNKRRSDLHDALAKAFVDQGRLIEAGFNGFMAMSYPKGCPEDQREMLRMAFFGGAQHLFSTVFSVLEDGGDEPTDKDMARMTSIAAELESFAKAFMARNLKPKGGVQ